MGNNNIKPVQTPVEQPSVPSVESGNTELNNSVSQKQMGKEYDNYIKNAKKIWKVNGAWEEPKSFDEFSDNFMKGFAKGSVAGPVDLEKEYEKNADLVGYDEFVKDQADFNEYKKHIGNPNLSYREYKEAEKKDEADRLLADWEKKFRL